VTEVALEPARAPVDEAAVVEGRPAAASLIDVGYVYPNGTVALEGLSLEIPRGRVTAIVGPSGCGKSTMLQLISRLAAPTSGSIDLHVDRRGDRHDVAMVFQQDTLLPWLTVTENVGLYYRFHRPKNRKQVRDEIHALLEMVGLEQFSDAYPGQLSGGMRRRVAFLASVAARPQLLLLDEAFSSVDEPTRILIHQEVLRIVHQLEMTTVLVTHDLAEAISLSDQVIIFSARPGKVYSRHDVPFGDDRDVLALRDRPEFLNLYGRLWHDLSGQIAFARRDKDQAPADG
jgi:ABC-type nitrate/sulfonate/bicarbonate transport system ATPase subunit